MTDKRGRGSLRVYFGSGRLGDEAPPLVRSLPRTTPNWTDQDPRCSRFRTTSRPARSVSTAINIPGIQKISVMTDCTERYKNHGPLPTSCWIRIDVSRADRTTTRLWFVPRQYWPQRNAFEYLMDGVWWTDGLIWGFWTFWIPYRTRSRWVLQQA